MYKKIVACAAAATLVFGAATAPAQTSLLDVVSITASAKTYEGFEYEGLGDGTVLLTDYIGNDAEVTVPSEIDGKTVTTLDSHVFDEKTSITQINIPASITDIRPYAIIGCENLTQINVDPKNSDYSSEDGILYTKNKKTLIKCPDKKTSATVPDSVTEFSETAFSGCKSLVSVELPEGLTKINESLFHFCESLTEVNIPDSVTEIGDLAFCGCKMLREVNIPDGVTEIGESAFYKCESLTHVELPDSLTLLCIGAFSGCTNLESINIPNNLESISDAAFSACKSLTEITLPEGIASIYPEAFCDCINLTDITFPDGLSYIGYMSFSGCPGITSVTIPASVDEIEEAALGYDFDSEKDEYIPYAGFTICGYRGTAAEQYAKDNGFAFVALGDGGAVANTGAAAGTGALAALAALSALIVVKRKNK